MFGFYEILNLQYWDLRGFPVFICIECHRNEKGVSSNLWGGEDDFALFLVAAGDDHETVESGSVRQDALILVTAERVPRPVLQQVQASLVHSKPQHSRPVAGKWLLWTLYDSLRLSVYHCNICSLSFYSTVIKYCMIYVLVINSSILNTTHQLCTMCIIN